MFNPARLTYVAIGLAVLSLIIAVVAMARPAPAATGGATSPTPNVTSAVKATFTPASDVLNLSTWDYTHVGTLQVSGGDALVRITLEGEVVSGYVKLVNKATGETHVEQLGQWVAVRAGAYDVYVKALMTSTDAQLRVEVYD